MTETMRALINYGPEAGAVELRDHPVPEPGDADVVLAVEAVGVCGSDVHQFQATHAWKVNYPVVLGHEFTGTVMRRGARATAFAEGARVVSETAAHIDPNSPLVREGRYNLDPARLGFGNGLDGAMADYVKVPERLLHQIPDSTPFEEAALTEPCCVAYNATCVQSPIRPGTSVLVIGPGPIGILSAHLASISGAHPVIMVGTQQDASRMEVATQMGVGTALYADGEDVVGTIRSLTNGQGPEVVIDAVGITPSLKLALEVVRPGGHITKVGWGPKPYEHSLDPLVAKAITLQGSFSHNWPIWEKVIALMAARRVDVRPMISRVAPLEDWRKCFDGMHRGELIKAVLTP